MTSLAENFTGGTTSLTWTAEVGSSPPAYVNDEAEVSGVGAAAAVMRAESDLATVNHEVTMRTLQLAGGDGFNAVFVRFSASALTGYSFGPDLGASPGDPTLFLVKWVAGAATVLATVANSANPAVGDPVFWTGTAGSAAASGQQISLRVETESGNARLKGFINGTEVINYLDNSSPITTGTRGGYYSDPVTPGNYWFNDTWTAADFGGGGGGPALTATGKGHIGIAARASVGVAVNLPSTIPVQIIQSFKGGPLGPAPPTPPPPDQTVDLIVEDLVFLVGGNVVSTINVGDQVVFRAVVRNIGLGTMPAGTISANQQLAVGFYVDGDLVTWADQYEGTLGPNATQNLTANGHPGDAAGANGVNYWVATSGQHTVTGFVNEITTRKVETNYANNQYSEVVNVAGGGGGGGGGAAPGDLLVGTPADLMLGWAGPDFLFKPASSHQLWKSRGFGGWTPGFQHMGPSTGLGGNYSFKGTSTSGDPQTAPPGNQWYYQQLAEGLLADNGFTNESVAVASAGMSGGLGWYTKLSGQDPDAPPLGGDWGNTTNRANIAAFLAGCAGFLNLMNWDYLHFDTELNGNGWSPGFGRQAAFDFGRVLAQAIYAVRPGLITLVYNWYAAFGFNSLVQERANGFTPGPGDAQEDFWMGYIAGMMDQNATGHFINADAIFYRPPSSMYSDSGVTYRNAYKYNAMGPLAWLSRISTPGDPNARSWASIALRNFMLQKLKFVGFTWLGTDGTSFYNNTQPDPTTFGQMLAGGRDGSMGRRRVEYNYEGHPDNLSYYSDPTIIGGMQAAANSAAIATVLPTITNIATTDNGGGTFTITCRASHPHGIAYVRFMLGGTTLGVGKMTFQPNGGAINTNLDASYQDVTVTLTGRSAGEIITLVAVSVKDDQKAATATLPGTPPVTPMPTVANTGPSSTNGTITAAQFLAAGSATNKIITGDLEDFGGAWAGRTFTATHCQFTGRIYYQEPTLLSQANYPHFILNNCEVLGGMLLFGPITLDGDHTYIESCFWTSWLNGGGEDHLDNQTNRIFPVTLTNSMLHAFRNPAPPPSFHTEALHVVSGCHNLSFTNCRFTQDGPWNDNTTAAMKVTCIDSTFANCWWDWNGATPGAFYTIYLEGRNVTVTGGHAQRATATSGGTAFNGKYYAESGTGPAPWSPAGGGGVNNYVVPSGLANIKDWFDDHTIGAGGGS